MFQVTRSGAQLIEMQLPGECVFKDIAPSNVLGSHLWPIFGSKMEVEIMIMIYVVCSSAAWTRLWQYSIFTDYLKQVSSHFNPVRG